jgi:serine protease Do
MTTLTALPAGAASLADELAELTTRLRRSLVVVRDGGRGAGSGVIWEANGVIVTNHHVAPGKRAQVVLPDGRTLDANVRVSDPHRDLAILDVPARGLPAAQSGDSDAVRVGELVFAVGNPLGLSGAVSAGIVTGVGRRFGSGRRRGEGLIQADVSLAPGNSGGPLTTADGRVIGINAMVHPPGLALAVPSNAVAALLATGSQGRAYLGLTLVAAQIPAAWALSEGSALGYLVAGVAPASPADQAGLLLGDLILAIDGAALESDEQLAIVLGEMAPGDELVLDVIRGGQAIRLSVVTGSRLEEAA